MNKSVFNFKIQYKDGSIIDLHDENLWVSSFRILSPEASHITDTIEGRHGSIYFGTELRERKITANFQIEADNYTDFDSLRDEMFQIFNSMEKFYIIRDLQPTKRMEVSVEGSFDIDYVTLEDGEFSVDFVIHSVYLESNQTTLESNPTGYTYTTTTFTIDNKGHIPIDPRFMPLLITYTGASLNPFTIKNVTTGDTWIHNGTSLTNDIIRLDKVRSTKNSLSILGSTNRKLITLAKGLNQFQLSGTSGAFEISFDFRYYYI